MTEQEIPVEPSPDGVITALFAHPHHTATPVSADKLTFEVGHGIQGDRHSGARHSDMREKTLTKLGLRNGSLIANLRHFSAISTEELVEISRIMLGNDSLPPLPLEPNIVITGIDQLSSLPVGTLLSIGPSALRFWRYGARMNPAQYHIRTSSLPTQMQRVSSHPLLGTDEALLGLSIAADRSRSVILSTFTPERLGNTEPLRHVSTYTKAPLPRRL